MLSRHARALRAGLLQPHQIRRVGRHILPRLTPAMPPPAPPPIATEFFCRRGIFGAERGPRAGGRHSDPVQDQRSATPNALPAAKPSRWGRSFSDARAPASCCGGVTREIACAGFAHTYTGAAQLLNALSRDRGVLLPLALTRLRSECTGSAAGGTTAVITEPQPHARPPTAPSAPRPPTGRARPSGTTARHDRHSSAAFTTIRGETHRHRLLRTRPVGWQLHIRRCVAVAEQKCAPRAAGRSATADLALSAGCRQQNVVACMSLKRRSNGWSSGRRPIRWRAP